MTRMKRRDPVKTTLMLISNKWKVLRLRDLMSGKWVFNIGDTTNIIGINIVKFCKN